MKKILITIVVLILCTLTHAQESPNNGFLLPRLTTAQRATMINPAKGIIIYNTDINAQEINTGTGVAPIWSIVNTSTNSSVSKWTNDNANTQITLTNFSDGISSRSTETSFVIKDNGNIGIGIINPQKKLEVYGVAIIDSISIHRGSITFSNNKNTGVGKNTLSQNNYGNFNTAIGANAMRYANDIGSGALYKSLGNTAIGADAMGLAVLEGSYNVAIGYRSMEAGEKNYSNVAVGLRTLHKAKNVIYNTAVGTDALMVNEVNDNTAFGAKALLYNTTGRPNVALGVATLYYNTTGSDNVAVGANALQNNISSDRNTAVGNTALFNTTGPSNTGVGFRTLYNNTTGSYNTAVGQDALYNNKTGSFNTALGFQSLYYITAGNFNIGIGYDTLKSITTGSQNIAIGYNSGSQIQTGYYNVILGSYSGLSIANSSNNIILSDGSGNDRLHIIGNGNTGINNNNPKAKLDVNGYIKVGSSDTTGDATPTAGMIRFNSVTSKFQGYNGTTWVDFN